MEKRETISGVKLPAGDGVLACLERGGRARWWRRCGSPRRGFRYMDQHGKPVTDERQLARIQAMALPPAWAEVRICPSERGKLQAVGVVAAGLLGLAPILFEIMPGRVVRNDA